MPSISVTLGDNPTIITDIAPYRHELEQVREQLQAIYTDFDPLEPERLLSRQDEIRTLFNRAEELRFAIQTWDAAAKSCADILVVWELVRQITGDGE